MWLKAMPEGCGEGKWEWFCPFPWEDQGFCCLLPLPKAQTTLLTPHVSPQASRDNLKCQMPTPPLFPISDFQNNVQVKLIRSPADLIRLIEELKAAEKVRVPGPWAGAFGERALPGINWRQ